MAGRGKDTTRSQDIGWDHFEPLDDNKKKVKCKWCNKTISGGIYRGKQHLAGVKGNVTACNAAPLDIRKEFSLYIRDKNVEKQKARAREDLLVDEMTRANEGSTDEDGSDPELQRVMRESRREFEMNEQSLRGGEGSSRQRVEIGRSASMRAPEVIGRNKRLSHVGIGPSHTQPTVDSFLYSKQTSTQPKITKAVLKGIKESKKFIGRAWTKWFVHDHIPAHAANSIYFKAAIKATQEAGTGIQPPTSKEIYNKYLPMEIDEIKTVIKSFHSHWDRIGCTIMCDGWTTQNRRNIINFLVYCTQGTIFIKSVDATTKFKDAVYISSLMSEVIEEVGATRVVQVVSDNGANFKAAGRLIMDQYNHIFWTPCAAHCIDLMLEDTGKDDDIGVIVKKAQDFTNFIYNHQWALNLMHEATDNRELLRPGITRFATQFITLQSIYSFKDALLHMCLKPSWAARVELLRTKKDKDGAGYVRDMLLDQGYWISVSETIQLFEPLIKVLRMVDSDDKAEMGFLYEAIDRAKEQIKRNLRSRGYKKWWKIIDNRWEKTLHRDIHAAGIIFI
jgi:hypothetical protein